MSVDKKPSNDQNLDQSKPDDDQVGYKCPPKSGQFKPGQSGNPKGRKRKPKSIADQVRNELKRKVGVTENGLRKSVPLQTVMLRTIAAKAAKGDLRSATFLFNLADKPENQTTDTIDPSSLSSEDKVMLDQAIRQLSSGEETECTTSDELN